LWLALVFSGLVLLAWCLTTPSAAAQCLPGGCTGDLVAGQCGQDEPICVENDVNSPPECCNNGIPGPDCTEGGCNGLFNCKVPQVEGPFIEATLEANGTYTARLGFEVTARWNRWAATDDNNPNGTLGIEWFRSSSFCSGQSSVCPYRDSDKTRCWLEEEGLTCGGAPYDFGVYSMRANVCNGGFGSCFCQANPLFCGCWRKVDRPAIPFVVTKADLGCPDPPKEACNGDAACTSCLIGGAGAGGGPPGFGGPGSP
jgi:hypothetical protein